MANNSQGLALRLLKRALQELTKGYLLTARLALTLTLNPHPDLTSKASRYG